MESRLLLIALILSVNCKIGSASVLDWLWGKTANDASDVLVADGVPLISIPYESMTEDEKFLQEAAKFTDIQVSSPLEICQHKVIMKIRTSCSDMTEEELAKLGVNLLNCQSAIEGRKMFPCTEEMVCTCCCSQNIVPFCTKDFSLFPLCFIYRRCSVSLLRSVSLISVQK